MAGPKPFGYSQPPMAQAPPMAPVQTQVPVAAPKSPSSYPPAQPVQPAWAPSGVTSPPKPAAQNVQGTHLNSITHNSIFHFNFLFRTI